MVVMMVVAVAVLALARSNLAMLFIAPLAGFFQLQGHMADAVGKELLPNGHFDHGRFVIRHNMSRCIVVLAIQRPNMDVMSVQNTFHLQNIVANLTLELKLDKWIFSARRLNIVYRKFFKFFLSRSCLS